LQTPLRMFLRTETGGAAVLLGMAVVALIWVNADASRTTPSGRPGCRSGSRGPGCRWTCVSG
jgi:hypothetical protein